MINMKNLFPGLMLLVVLVVSGIASQAAEAKQTSLDSRIFETFKKIDGRTNAHEQDTNEIRKRLGDISGSIESLNAKLAEIDDDDEAVAAAKRRNIRGELIENSAEYLNQAFKLVDAAALVISANLSDLAKLAKEVRKSGDPRGSVEKIKSRIRRNVSAGKSMRRAMVELRNWAHQDPKLAGRFQSLRRITLSLDGRISIDKARLAGRTSFSPVRAQHDRLAALDRTVDRLSDMYAEVMAEKESLIDLRDEVAMSIQLGRLAMTREVAERAIPNLIRPRDPSLGIKSLKNVAAGIAKLNGSLIDTASGAPEVTANQSPARPIELPLDGFQNF
jgi:hypothetical protein